MSTTPDLEKAHEAAQAASDGAVAAMEAAHEAYALAIEARHHAMETNLECYEASVLAANALNEDPATTEHQKTLTKSHLVSLHTQGLLLAQELDNPEYSYQQRLRDITQRRKDLLGY